MCPSDDLTLPEKEMILFGMKLTTFFHLLWLGLLFVLVKALVCRRKKKNCHMGEQTHLQQTDESPRDVAGGLTLVHRLEITCIKFLKMYYTPGKHYNPDF